MVVLLLFVGLAIDFGMAYVTRAQLSKAADAAALTAARYSALGTAQATTLAQEAFAMNYNSSSLNYVSNPNGAPGVVVTPTYCPGSTCPTASSTLNGMLWSVTASATNQTYFAGLLPGFSTLNVATASQSLARTVEMTLVVDRTGSMLPVSAGGEDGGCAYLPGAVNDFITYFDNTHDSVALVSFADNVTITAPMGVPMTTGGFLPAVTAVTASMMSGGSCTNFFYGGTWTEGGMQQALTTENTFTPPAGTNPQKVVVLFTDGNANTIQAAATCTGGTGRGITSGGTYNIGGFDANNAPTVGFDTPNTNYTQVCQENDSSCCSNGGGSPGTFPSLAAGGTQVPITWANVSSVGSGDAAFRAVAIANSMRAAGITVYAVGLGGAFTSVDQGFLCQIANDPCSTTYNSTLPTGAMEYAATGDALDAAFQAVASIIRLRLTQ
jgi:Flp pilus assembly protein TadG